MTTATAAVTRMARICRRRNGRVSSLEKTRLSAVVSVDAPREAPHSASRPPITASNGVVAARMFST